MEEEKAFSSIDLVGQCLIDEPRTLAFEKAIKKVVKPEHIVLDAGTGSGIMALFSARAGAKKVYALERDEYVADSAMESFKSNNFGEKITLFKGDAKTFEFPKDTHFDVVVMEMLTTGMVDEFQVQAANNLHKQKVVNENTVFVPKSQETYISLAETRFNIYGFSIKMVKHLWNNLSKNQKAKMLSDKVLLNSVDFSIPNEENFSTVLKIRVNKSGVLNSVYLSSICCLMDGFKIKDTETLNSPVVVPFLKDINVKKGEEINIKVSYKYGEGYKNFKVDLV